MNKILLKKIFTLFNVSITVANLIYALSLMLVIVGNFICLFYFNNFTTLLFFDMSVVLTLYILSATVGILTKLYEHKQYVCPVGKNHIKIIIILCKIISWILLLFGFYLFLLEYKKYSVVLYFVSYIFDIGLITILTLAFYTFIKIINNEIKE
ncbi:MAG: hypothetical protein AB7V16_06960 [Vulcanibacillus sp.]